MNSTRWPTYFFALFPCKESENKKEKKTKKQNKKQTTGVSNPIRSRDFFLVGKVVGSNGIRYPGSRGGKKKRKKKKEKKIAGSNGIGFLFFVASSLRPLASSPQHSSIRRSICPKKKTLPNPILFSSKWVF